MLVTFKKAKKNCFLKYLFQFKIPLKRPPANQTFDLSTFKKVTGKNTLTKALQAKFTTALDAAWQYMTLKQSYELLETLKGPEPQVNEGLVIVYILQYVSS